MLVWASRVDIYMCLFMDCFFRQFQSGSWCRGPNALIWVKITKTFVMLCHSRFSKRYDYAFNGGLLGAMKNATVNYFNTNSPIYMYNFLFEN